MLRSKNRLLLNQLDSKMAKFNDAVKSTVPAGGWIHAIRTALNMSLRQLGDRLNMSPAGVRQMETREEDGSITLNSLRNAAAALNMQFVYAFVAPDTTIEAIIDERAHKLAEDIVRRTSTSMALEDQENSAERIKKAIEERAEELKNEHPRLLWN